MAGRKSRRPAAGSKPGNWRRTTWVGSRRCRSSWRKQPPAFPTSPVGGRLSDGSPPFAWPRTSRLLGQNADGRRARPHLPPAEDLRWYASPQWRPAPRRRWRRWGCLIARSGCGPPTRRSQDFGAEMRMPAMAPPALMAKAAARGRETAHGSANAQRIAAGRDSSDTTPHAAGSGGSGSRSCQPPAEALRRSAPPRWRQAPHRPWRHPGRRPGPCRDGRRHPCLQALPSPVAPTARHQSGRSGPP